RRAGSDARSRAVGGAGTRTAAPATGENGGRRSTDAPRGAVRAEGPARTPARLWRRRPHATRALRLSETYTRGLRELPPPPGPVRIYSCGPTVYQRIHVGNAVPFVVAMWLRSWLRNTGYETKLVINI